MNLGTACLFWIFWPGNPFPPRRDPTPDVRSQCEEGALQSPLDAQDSWPVGAHGSPREKDPGATLKGTGGQIIFLTVYKGEEEKGGQLQERKRIPCFRGPDSSELAT